MLAGRQNGGLPTLTNKAFSIAMRDATNPSPIHPFVELRPFRFGLLQLQRRWLQRLGSLQDARLVLFIELTSGRPF